MSFSELMAWKNNSLSKLAGSDRRAINLSLRLKRKGLYSWISKDFRGAIKAISHLKRAKRIKSNTYVTKEYTENDLMLKNFGYDPHKQSIIS